MIKIYGSPRSSAGRCYLVLEEVGQPYEVMPLDMMEKREHKSEAFLKLNPNGKVPCIQDGDFVLWESLAINQYLAEKFKPELLGAGAAERALVQQWSIWGLVELQPPMVEILIQMMFTPEPKRDMAIVAKAKEKIPHTLQVLEQALNGRQYLVGNKVTIADLNVASVVNTAMGLQIPMENYKNITKWFQGIAERPSFKKFQSLRKS
jgi:glutathione S-transferase